MEYNVSLANTFEAENVVDAILQMAEWLTDNAYMAGYVVEKADGEVIFVDAKVATAVLPPVVPNDVISSSEDQMM